VQWSSINEFLVQLFLYIGILYRLMQFFNMRIYCNVDLFSLIVICVFSILDFTMLDSMHMFTYSADYD